MRQLTWRGAWLLALPVWLALGLLLGPQMWVPTGAQWVISFILVQPLIEELLFRGLLQGGALHWLSRQGKPLMWGPVSLANIVVSLSFVALHLRAQPLAWALAVALPSLVLGHLRERYRSVWPAVATHAYYNAGFALTAALAQCWRFSPSLA